MKQPKQLWNASIVYVKAFVVCVHALFGVSLSDCVCAPHPTDQRHTHGAGRIHGRGRTSRERAQLAISVSFCCPLAQSTKLSMSRGHAWLSSKLLMSGNVSSQKRKKPCHWSSVSLL